MHIVLSLKDMGKVFAVRSRRSTKNKHSTAIEHDGDSSIPADIHGSFPSPTLHSNISYSQGLGVSLAREASDLAQLALPLVQTAVGVIPLVGPPMKVAIGGLLEILQAVDRRGQNRADLDGLELRLHRLSSHLCNAPPVQDPLEQSRRDSLVSMLQETSAQLTKLHRRVLAYTSVTQAIAGCSSQIDRYLAEYSLSSQMQSQHDMREVLASQQRHHEENQRHHEENQKLLMEIQRLTIRVGPTATQLTGTVTLIDATGHEHPISVNFCTSFQQLNEMLQVLFKRDSIEARVQRQYIENGQYDLCIDEGTRVTQLTNHRWSSIEEGTKIVMRVIIEHKKTSSEVYYTCHFCGARNHLPSGSVNHSLGRQVGCSIDCRECKRRFQISHRYLSSEESTGSSNIDSNSTTEAEMHLIRNFHVQQTEAKILSKKFFIYDPESPLPSPPEISLPDPALSQSDYFSSCGSASSAMLSNSLSSLAPSIFDEGLCAFNRDASSPASSVTSSHMDVGSPRGFFSTFKYTETKEKSISFDQAGLPYTVTHTSPRHIVKKHNLTLRRVSPYAAMPEEPDARLFPSPPQCDSHMAWSRPPRSHVLSADGAMTMFRSGKCVSTNPVSALSNA